jgi:hypothetical protein
MTTISAARIAMLSTLLLSTSSSAAEPGDGVLLICDPSSTHGGYCSDSYWTLVSETYRSYGVDWTNIGSVPSSVTDYHLVFIAFPGAYFSTTEVAVLAEFLENKGRLVLVAENNTYFTPEINRLNDLLVNLEVEARFEQASIDLGCGHGSPLVHSHPITDGISDYAYGYTTWIYGGTPLVSHDYLDGRLDSIVAVDQPVWALDSPGSEVVLFGDSNGLITGCNPIENEPLVWNLYDFDATDADADGYVDSLSGGSDCDDADAAVNPGATEECNGLDDDCNTTVPSDERDEDADGVMECEGDCDDDDETSYPGAEEIPYDGADNDCDGSDLTDVDEDGVDAEEAGGTDCNDEDASIYPGAEETADDGIDQDCDGEDLILDTEEESDDSGHGVADGDEGSKDTGGCSIAAGRGGLPISLMAGLLVLGARRRNSAN